MIALAFVAVFTIYFRCQTIFIGSLICFFSASNSKTVLLLTDFIFLIVGLDFEGAKLRCPKHLFLESYFTDQTHDRFFRPTRRCTSSGHFFATRTCLRQVGLKGAVAGPTQKDSLGGK